MKYKYVLFDLDGTLTDSKEGITKSVQYALKKYGITVENLDSLEVFIGPPLKDSFMEYYNFDAEKAVKAIGYYREYFEEKGLYENKVYDNVEDLLVSLKKLGLKLIIATSKPTVFSETILKNFNLDKYFDAIVGSNLDGTRSKKGQVIEYALENCNITNLEEVVMVGDRKHDVIGAKGNNIDCIGVRYGYGSPEELKSATYVVDSPDEVFKCITRV